MRPILVAATAALALSTTAQAATPSSGNFGLGLGGGTGVTGLSGKYYLGESSAVQGMLGWWGLGHDASAMGLGADYLLEMPAFAEADPLKLGWNAGAGGMLWVWDGGGAAIAGSGVLGLEVLLQPIPLDIVLEYRPTVLIIPDVYIDLVNFTGHIRYYF